MEMEKQMFGKQMFAGPCTDDGTDWTLISRPCQVSPITPSPLFFAGDSSILGTGPSAKFF